MGPNAKTSVTGLGRWTTDVTVDTEVRENVFLPQIIYMYVVLQFKLQIGNDFSASIQGTVTADEITSDSD